MIAASRGSSWNEAFLDAHPGIGTLMPVRRPRAWTDWPDVAQLQCLLDGLQRSVTNADGRPLRLEPAPAGTGASEYERRIFHDAVLGVRTGAWHDLFNVLVWTVWPSAKAALNARHVTEIERQTQQNRSPVRDALTGFDEDGVIVAVVDPTLAQLARDFRWKALFWGRRADLAQNLRVFVFGHALAEKLLAPFVGLTAKAVFANVEPAFLTLTLGQQRAQLDARLAACIRGARFGSPRRLAPLPVLGLPGWFPAGEHEHFYADAAYFRSGRSRAPPGC